MEFTTSEWIYSKNSYVYPVDTTFSNSRTILEFNKNGKVELTINGNEENFKVNFKSKKLWKNESGYFKDLMVDRYFRNDTGLVYYGSFYNFKGNFYPESSNDPICVYGIVNQDNLRLQGGKTIISTESTSTSRHKYGHYFKRIN